MNLEKLRAEFLALDDSVRAAMNEYRVVWDEQRRLSAEQQALSARSKAAEAAVWAAIQRRNDFDMSGRLRELLGLPAAEWPDLISVRCGTGEVKP